MKYLQDDKLTHWTGILTAVAVGHSRVLNGRVEVYSMKRAGSDKKYAATLGEKYVEQIHQDQEMAAKVVASSSSSLLLASSNNNNNQRPRKRSSSEGVLKETENKEGDENSPNKRQRSCSFDQAARQLALFPQKRPTALGDFTQQATRRLMTDLILTLNASFPDYDFGSVKAEDFSKVKATTAMATINHHLSEWARNHYQSSNKNILEELWESINEAVPLKDCDIYKFVPADGLSLMTTWEEEEEDENTASANLWSFYYLFVNKATKRILLFTATESMRATTKLSDEDDDSMEEYIGVTEVEPDGRFDLDPAAATPGGIPISSI